MMKDNELLIEELGYGRVGKQKKRGQSFFRSEGEAWRMILFKGSKDIFFFFHFRDSCFFQARPFSCLGEDTHRPIRYIIKILG